MPIFRFGTDEQKKRYLPGLCRGGMIGAHGMSEPGSGSDAFSLSTTANRVGDSYILNGVENVCDERARRGYLRRVRDGQQSEPFHGCHVLHPGEGIQRVVGQ